ncbi:MULTISPECIES: serine hydrolase domain-containing protein [Niastella]|uniref:Serine hydrolase n=1 Tax=Niastella soli TaxID=2821487 RepID=A0ABS3YQJ8_9BACT|nr:serine hydrolase [Niastella soli]MBO9200191.1 serine hydrolase [Niastella soli]
MKLYKNILRFVLLMLVVALAYGGWYAWRAFPIISGYGAKNMASAVYLQHRNPESVLKEELGFFPVSKGTYTINPEDSSVTGSVWGFAKRKAIYRTGLGCTLVNDLSEAEIRKQHFSLPVIPSQNVDTIAWPYGDKISDSISPVVDNKALQQAVDNAMQMPSKKGDPAYTRAFLVVYDGKIVGERYAPGFNKKSVMIGWSMTKSLTSAIIGVLVKAGKLDPNSPAPVPEWQHTNKEKITLKNLLQQSSGLDYTENYNSPSEATNMLFKRADMGGFTAKLPLKYEPGTIFNYSSGNANILGRIIRQTVGDSIYAAFPYNALFHKINMYSLVLEPDASGTYVASSYSYASARDFARFGLLYYNNGVWNGEQLLPVNWVKETVQPAPANKQLRYGYQFWLNGLDDKDPNKRWFPDAPADMYFADGYGGQNIFIIPSKKLIIVRLGVRTVDENKYLKEVIAAIKN